MLNANDFKIIKVDDGFILVNMRKYHGLQASKLTTYVKSLDAWKRSHTHLKSHQMALIIRDNLIKHKLPKTQNEYLLNSYIRVSDDPNYQDKIRLLINTRHMKGKQVYFNHKF